jgi:hypothetical protein
MRKLSILYGTIGLALICSVGLLSISMGVAQSGLGSSDELIAANPSLRDIVADPEQYFGQTLYIEGYILSPDVLPWSDWRGEFFITDSLDHPTEVGIWAVFSDKAEVVPALVPSNSKATIIGELVFKPDTAYKHQIEVLEIMSMSEIDPMPPQPMANLELFTNKDEY